MRNTNHQNCFLGGDELSFDVSFSSVTPHESLQLNKRTFKNGKYINHNKPTPVLKIKINKSAYKHRFYLTYSVLRDNPHSFNIKKLVA